MLQDACYVAKLPDGRLQDGGFVEVISVTCWYFSPFAMPDTYKGFDLPCHTWGLAFRMGPPMVSTCQCDVGFW